MSADSRASAKKYTVYTTFGDVDHKASFERARIASENLGHMFRECDVKEIQSVEGVSEIPGITCGRLLRCAVPGCKAHIQLLHSDGTEEFLGPKGTPCSATWATPTTEQCGGTPSAFAPEQKRVIN